MTRKMLPFVIALCLAPAFGCRERGHDPPTPSPLPVAASRSVAGTPDGRVEISVGLDRAEMRTVDRLTLTISTLRPVGLRTTLDDPDWAAAGWTRVGATDSEPLAMPDGLIQRTRTVVLEPFLDGVYSIPPVVLSWTPGESGGEHTVVSTEQMTVTVGSVLASDDVGELAGPAPTRPAPTTADGGYLPVVVVGACVLVAGALAWFLVRPREGGEDPTPGPVESLRAIAARSSAGEEWLAPLHRALAELAPARAALNPLVHQCERARFDPGASAADAGEIAREALRRLGVSS